MAQRRSSVNSPSPARRVNRRLPAALLLDAFRPLGFFAGEFLAALAPLLPAGVARRLFFDPRSDEPDALTRWLDDLSASEETHV